MDTIKKGLKFRLVFAGFDFCGCSTALVFFAPFRYNVGVSCKTRRGK
jgi:hypothetical protein